jgi:hypothetical protein
MHSLALIVAMGAIGALATSADAQSLNVPLITGPDSLAAPDISGTYISYFDGTTSTAFVYDWRRGTTTQLPSIATHPRMSGHFVVYDNENSAEATAQVYLYNVASHKAIQISGSYQRNVDPDISGHYVVWSASSPGSGGVVIYDIETRTATTIPDTTNAGLPTVGDRWVTWPALVGHSSDGSPLDTIYAYNLTTRQTVVVDSQDLADAPRSSGDVVVWHDDRGLTPTSVYMKDLGTGVEQRVSNGADNCGYAAISGPNVAYTDFDSTQGDVFEYNGSTGLTYPDHQQFSDPITSVH